MKKAIICLITVFIAIHGFSQDCNIYFDFNSDIMRINDIGKLNKIIDEHRASNKKILLVGHTDTVGNAKFNIELSERRVNNVKKYLVDNNIKKEKIAIDFKGETRTVNTNQFYNRRVEVFLQTDNSNITTYTEFVESIKPTKQLYLVPTDIETVIEGKRGTIITIPANSFVTKDGTIVKGNVEISLLEYYNISDFISDRLSTVSNGNLLTSAGMIDISVSKNGKDLELKNEIDIEVAFPKSSDSRFYTFYGERMEDGRMNWISDKRQLATDKPKDWSVTIGEDGNSLITTDAETAKARNAALSYSPFDSVFKIMNEEERKKLDVYYAEQERIELEKGKYYNILTSNKLHFINCDEYVRDPSAIIANYNIIIENQDLDLFSAYLIFRNSNSILELQNLSGNSFGINARMPVNQEVKLLVIGQQNGKIYKYYETTKISTKVEEKISLKESNFEDLKSVL